MKVIFEGAPPFQLPSPQSARAYAVDDTVELALYVVIDGLGSDPLPMRVQMLAITALELAPELVEAGRVAQSKARS